MVQRRKSWAFSMSTTVHLAQGGPSSSGTWTRWPLEISANTNCSVSVWCWHNNQQNWDFLEGAWANAGIWSPLPDRVSITGFVSAAWEAPSIGAELLPTPACHLGRPCFPWVDPNIGVESMGVHVWPSKGSWAQGEPAQNNHQLPVPSAS